MCICVCVCVCVCGGVPIYVNMRVSVSNTSVCVSLFHVCSVSAGLGVSSLRNNESSVIHR